MTTESDLRPLQPIRRFDVFAETKRLEALAHGEPDDVAKGYGIRIAKIVASRRFGGTPKKDHAKKKSASEREPSTGDRFRGEGDARFRALDGELQTDETFDHDIIDRMGPEFYEVVFQPAIREALAEGRKYEQFRDTIRKDWKPNRG
ncbi:MAG: hypothetical protein K0S78_18 [Thermomicrobiales bacterium]|jgi:hypothetical protein|nr:hypothetical protein [Thermomicrobiales bacterium]MDF3037701.1 hypothetical protein [Thermomicrobiales bacterium]